MGKTYAKPAFGSWEAIELSEVLNVASEEDLRVRKVKVENDLQDTLRSMLPDIYLIKSYPATFPEEQS